MSNEYFKHLFEASDKHRDMVLAAERFIWQNPETGYREWKTSAYLEKEFTKLGYTLKKAGNIPGFYTDIYTGKPGPTVLVFGELDSLICRDHPEADPETGAVHSCGHNAQCAALLGVAAALRANGALDGLCGTIRLCAVPAEELIELGYREELRRQGIIKYFGGKVEFLYRGYFDDVDLALMVHTSNLSKKFLSRKGSIGCITKTIIYRGKAAHAGGAPQNGINALYAATLGLQAINSIRETFIDNDHIRVHPIITKGGNAVNAIPNEVVLESYIRGLTIDAILNVNKKVNRALAGAAVCIGAKVEIIDRPGYMPLINDENLKSIAEEAMSAVVPKNEISIVDEIGTGCTDMGDISAVMPAVHPYAAGASGQGHGNDYFITDPELACMNSAKMQLAMLKILLSNNAEKAKEVIAKKNPPFKSYAEYFKVLDQIFQDKDAVTYNEDETILIS
ncbi:MAG TPA: amidohydrolase [Clostridiaceae bacterium]|nr:amidohydrolase [Clostridiaceae bacterium]